MEGVQVEPPVKRVAARGGARAALSRRVRRAPHPGLPADAALPAERIPPSVAAAPSATAWKQFATGSAHVSLSAEVMGQYMANPVSPTEAELPSARSTHSWRAASVEPDASHGRYSAGRPIVEHIDAEETHPGGGGGSGGGNIIGTNSGLSFGDIAHTHAAGTLPRRSTSVQLTQSESSPSPGDAAKACAEVLPPLQAFEAGAPSKRGARSGSRASGYPLELPPPASKLLSRESRGAAAREPPSPSFSAMERAASAAAAQDWGSLSNQVLSLHCLQASSCQSISKEVT